MGLFSIDPQPGQPLTGELPAAPPPRRPFAGFLVRMFALVIDGLIFYALGGMLDNAVRPGLLALNPWLPWIGLALVFLYFLLAAGPVGHGRTLGMAILGLHIVDREGNPPAFAAALKRTAIQMVAIYGVLSFNSQLFLLGLPDAWQYAGLLAISMLTLSSVTLLITLTMAVAMHPFKQGWHDVLAGTYVTADPTPLSFEEALNGPMDQLTERKLVNYWKMTVPFWAISMIALAYTPVQTLLRPDVRFIIADAATLSSQRHLGPDVRLLQLAYPAPDGIQNFDNFVHRTQTQALNQRQDVPTTETLRAQTSADGRTIIVIAFQIHGTFDKARLDDPALHAQAEALRAAAWEQWQAYRAEADRHSETVKQPEAERFWLQWIEPLVLTVHNGTKPVAKMIGPADPAGGPLTYTAIEPPFLTGDSATTAPQAQASPAP